MQTQGDLYGGFARTTTHQGQLFDTDGPAELALSCGECGRPMVRTPSGYISCPKGHGKLAESPSACAEGDQDDDERSGLWFEDDPEEIPGRRYRLHDDHPSLTDGERNYGSRI